MPKYSRFDPKNKKKDKHKNQDWKKDKIKDVSNRKERKMQLRKYELS